MSSVKYTKPQSQKVSLAVSQASRRRRQYRLMTQKRFPSASRTPEQARNRLRLLHISRQLTKKNLEELTYLLQDILSEKEAKQATSATAIVSLMERKGLIGSTSYSLLKQWLKCIGRSDLSKQLPQSDEDTEDWTGREEEEEEQVEKEEEEVEEDEVEDTEKRKEEHRFALMDISRSLRKQELHELVYLCGPHICDSSTEDITEAFQLFTELERVGKINAGNNCYLAKCLLHIGRVDLFNKLARLTEGHLVDSNLPETAEMLQGAVHNYTTVFYNSKRSEYAQSMKALDEATSKQAWMALTERVMSELYLAWKLDLPFPMWQPNTSCDQQTTDQIIHDSLVATFAFAEAEMEARNTLPMMSAQSYGATYMKCTEEYKHLERNLDLVEWNPLLRAKVSQIMIDRASPQGMAVRQAKKCISDFCVDILQEKGLEKEMRDQDAILYGFELTYYEGLLGILVTQWISNILYLAKEASIDLSKHLELFKELLYRHRKGIIMATPVLSKILGDDVLKKAASIILENRDDTPGSDDSPMAAYSLQSVIQWYILLLELFGFASGCELNPRQVADRFMIYSMEQNFQGIIRGGMIIAEMVTDQLYTQMAEYKAAALCLANSTPHKCKEVLAELFQ